MIPYGRQSISQEDVDAVVKVLQSDYLTQGPAVPVFEDAVASVCKVHHAVAVNSATSALHIACLALDVGPGDSVWTSPTTFVASANCARYCGANVDFVDIDPNTWCLSVDRLADKLRRHQNEELSLPKVVIPVHLSGQSCDMERIAELGKKYGFSIIEDASHALGSSYQGEPVGGCRFSDIAVFSFHPVKIITTGEGGMALTNNVKLSQHMARLRTHGITRDPAYMTVEPKGLCSYEQVELGFNYRMTDIQASLGLSQLDRLEEFVTRRNELAESYDKILGNLPLRLQKSPKDVRSARHLYVIRVEAKRHRELFDFLRQVSIGVNLHYMPVHLQPYYRSLGFVRGQFPEAEAYGQEAISIPLYPSITNDEQNEIAANISRFLEFN